MNKRKLIMFSIILIALVCVATTPIMAKTYHKNIKISYVGKDLSSGKYIGSSNYLYADYDYKYSKSMYINIVPNFPYWNYVTKANVKYVKKVNGKNKYMTKTYKAKKSYRTADWIKPRQKLVDSSILVNKLPKNWKPVSAKVFYKKKVYKGN
ncbi:MAG: hypothetical protein FWH54_01450 [Methanobrevibacter sp.]|nr:hypothetical protein [Methanobrevibacter sp.]